MPAGNRENPLLKKGNSDAFFREKRLTKKTTAKTGIYIGVGVFTIMEVREEKGSDKG